MLAELFEALKPMPLAADGLARAAWNVAKLAPTSHLSRPTAYTHWAKRICNLTAVEDFGAQPKNVRGLVKLKGHLQFS